MLNKQNNLNEENLNLTFDQGLISSISKNTYLANFTEESIKLFRDADWLAMEEKAVLSEEPPPMDRRVLTEGFLSWTVLVNCENGALFEEETVTWFVLESRSAKAQNM